MSEMVLAKIVFLVVGMGAGYYLMLDKKGAFDIQNAGGLRIAHAFVLLLLGGWFSSAHPDSKLVQADYVVIALLAIAAIGAYFHRRK